MVTICATSVTITNSTFCPHSVFMCSLCIWEQTAIISLHIINWLVFIIDTEPVYCAVRTESYSFKGLILIGFYNRHGVYLLCGTDWILFFKGLILIDFYNRHGVCLLRGTDWILFFKGLILIGFFIIDTESVYCAVRTESYSLKGWYWLAFIIDTESVYRAVRTESYSLKGWYWLAFIIDRESVYCAVRTESFSLKGW